MFAAEATILLPCRQVVLDVASAVAEGFATMGWDRLLPDGPA